MDPGFADGRMLIGRSNKRDSRSITGGSMGMCLGHFNVSLLLQVILDF